jgi:hypothetical protein
MNSPDMYRDRFHPSFENSLNGEIESSSQSTSRDYENEDQKLKIQVHTYLSPDKNNH